jgi:hypothetical protein
MTHRRCSPSVPSTTFPTPCGTQVWVSGFQAPGRQLGRLGAARWAKRQRIRPSIGLRSVGGTVDMLSSSCGDCGGGGEGIDLVMGGPPLTPLDPDLGARVSVGRSCSSTWIRAVKWCGDSSTRVGNISIGYSLLSSSSSTSPCPPPPSPRPDDEGHNRRATTGLGHRPQSWTVHDVVQRPLDEVAGSEGAIGQ